MYFPSFLYASESWTLGKQMEDKINAFEKWIFRHMFTISHLDRKTKVEPISVDIGEMYASNKSHYKLTKGTEKILIESVVFADMVTQLEHDSAVTRLVLDDSDT